MNIFYLHEDTRVCAEMHCDKHVVKMIIEYSQLLCTAHRVLDGTETIGLSKSGRRLKRWVFHEDDSRNNFHLASHVKHPSGIWCRENHLHYNWLYNLYVDCCKEYTYRYGKVHACERFIQPLSMLPQKISMTGKFTQPPLCMPDPCKISTDAIISYQHFYRVEKAKFATWKNRPTPKWFLI